MVGHHHLPGLRDPDPGHPDRAPAERGVGLTGFLLSVRSVFTVYDFGVTGFGAGGDPNGNLAALGCSHQGLQDELSQIVPLAVIIVIGVAFYLLGSGTRRQEVTQPVAPLDGTAAAADPAP